MHNIVCNVYQVFSSNPPKHTHNPIKYLLVTIYKWNTWA